MKKDPTNPLNMVPDPYAGDTFVLPDTWCTNERRVWFHRAKEILALYMVTSLALQECRNNFHNKIVLLPFKDHTPIKIENEKGMYVVAPVSNLIEHTHTSIAILSRQVFVMLYGTFETFLFEIFDRSYPWIGIRNNTLDVSVNILMKKKWRGKFSKMNEVFDIGYKDRALTDHLSGFEMNFQDRKYANPLDFLDELAHIRHRIVHASSIIDDSFLEKNPTANLEKGQTINIDADMFDSTYAFYALLTDYVDKLFAEKFAYNRIIINPADA